MFPLLASVTNVVVNDPDVVSLNKGFLALLVVAFLIAIIVAIVAGCSSVSETARADAAQVRASEWCSKYETAQAHVNRMQADVGADAYKHQCFYNDLRRLLKATDDIITKDEADYNKRSTPT